MHEPYIQYRRVGRVGSQHALTIEYCVVFTLTITSRHTSLQIQYSKCNRTLLKDNLILTLLQHQPTPSVSAAQMTLASSFNYICWLLCFNSLLFKYWHSLHNKLIPVTLLVAHCLVLVAIRWSFNTQPQWLQRSQVYIHLCTYLPVASARIPLTRPGMKRDPWPNKQHC